MEDYGFDNQSKYYKGEMMNKEIYEAVRELINNVTDNRLKPLCRVDVKTGIAERIPLDKLLAKSLAEAVLTVDEIAEIIISPHEICRGMTHGLKLEMKDPIVKAIAKAIYDTLLKNLKEKK